MHAGCRVALGAYSTPAARRLPMASPGGELAGIARGVTPGFGSLESARGGLDGAGVEVAQLDRETGDRRKCAIVGRGLGSSFFWEALRSKLRAELEHGRGSTRRRGVDTASVVS